MIAPDGSVGMAYSFLQLGARSCDLPISILNGPGKYVHTLRALLEIFSACENLVLNLM